MIMLRGFEKADFLRIA